MNNLNLFRATTVVLCLMICNNAVFGQYIALSPNGNFQLSSIINPYEPTAIAIDSKGNLYQAATAVAGLTGPEDGGNNVLKWNGYNGWELVAGNQNGSTVFSGDGGPATAAGIGYITGLATDRKGNLYILDNEDMRIRKVDTNGVISTCAGGGVTMGWADGVPATSTLLNQPISLACDKWGNLFIGQLGDNRIRKVDTNGMISTIAGTGIYGYSGDGGAATLANLQVGTGLAVDTLGNIYLAGTNCRKIGTDGIIRSIAGNGVPGYSGDGGPATNASITAGNVSVDRSGNVFLTTNSTISTSPSFSFNNCYVRRVDTSGVITSVAGTSNVYAIPQFYNYSLNSYVTLPANQVLFGSNAMIQNDTAGNLLLLDVNYSWFSYLISFNNGVPGFYYGNNPTLSFCKNSVANNLDGYLAVYNQLGTSVNWSVAVTPTHGTVICSYSAASTDTLLVPSGISYTPDAGYTGSDLMVIAISNGITTHFDTVHVTITSPETIIGDSVLCISSNPSTFYLSVPDGQGTWSYFFGGAYTVNLDTFVLGSIPYSTTISISYTNGCGIVSKSVTVSPAPAILGSIVLCPGDTTLLSSMMPGGVWSSTNGNLEVTTSGVVTGIATGLDTIQYTSVSGCISSKQMQVGLIDVLPSDTAVCSGTTGLFTNGPYQTWTVSDPSAVFIEESGDFFNFNSPGVAVVTATNVCGSISTTISVNPIPGAVSITSAYVDGWSVYDLCIGSSYLATETIPGGIWSATGGTASIDSFGNITPLGNEGVIGQINYTVAGCTASIPVQSYSSSVRLLCDSVGCPGSLFGVVAIDSLGPTYGDFNGYFSCSNPLMNAVADNGDNPYEHYYSCPNVTAGVVTFSYSNLCATVLRTVTINPQPAVPDVSPVICAGSTVTATDATAGGIWGTSYGNASITSGGVVSTVHGNWDNIIYTLPTGCYNSAPIHISTVSPMPIMGNGIFCAGEHLNLVDSSSGGVWTSSDSAIVNNAMVAIAAGTATITYNNGCGEVTKSVTVLPAPAPIGGHDSLCRTSSVTYTDATPGGTWSVTGSGSITSGGLFTPSGTGWAQVSYTLSNGCVYSQSVEIDAPASITAGLYGDSVFCGPGIHTGIYDSAAGGYWVSSNTTVAYIDYGSSSSIYIYSNEPGRTILTHNVTNACGSFSAHKHITVYPAAGNTFLNTQICQFTSYHVYEADSTGIWLNYNSHAALASPVNLVGSIIGITPGVDTITYTDDNVCGASTVYYITTINATPLVAPIVGDSVICYGSSISFSDATAGGIWSDGGDGYILSGTYYAINPGIATIRYTVESGICSASATRSVTIYPPTGIIADSMHLCEGTEALITSSYPGGSWTNLDTNAAILSTSSIGATVEALTEPRDTVIYGISSVCGLAEFMHIVLIDVYLPSTPILGDSVMCAGDSVILTGEPLSGVWSSSNTSLASVSSGGVITGLAGGTSIISFSATNACGEVTETKTVTVYPLSGFVQPDSISLCVGSSLTFADPIGGGGWASTGSGVALLPGLDSLIAMGVAPGIDTLQYTLSSGCGTAVYRHIIHVSNPSYAGTISGSEVLCMGFTDTLTNSAAGGVWSSSSTDVATVTDLGIVLGLSPGVSVISYSVFGCDTAMAAVAVTVYPLPSSSSVDSISICSGTSSIITAPISGGIWSTAFGSAILTVFGDSVSVTGSSGTDTVYYTISSLCGATTYKHLVRFLTAPSAGTISGSLALCVGSEGLLTSSVGGGIWSESGGAITLLTGGTIFGESPGTATVYYLVANICGSESYSALVTVFPVSTSIIDSQSLCLGATLSLTAAPIGGVWSITNGNAAFLTSGSGSRLVLGEIAGRDTAVYTYTGFCGTSVSTHILVIDTIPVLPDITGDSTVCSGQNLTLSDSLSGGYWTSSNSAVAAVSVGVVSGISPGVAEISYTVSGCSIQFVTRKVTVITSEFITLDSVELCTGTTIILTGTPSGGYWSLANVHLTSLSIDSNLGVTGVSVGRDTVVYIPPAGCVLGYRHLVSIISDTLLEAIMGDSILCAGTTAFWTESVPGGTWVTGNPSVATISSGGTVSAVSAGTTVISYNRTEVCDGVHSVSRTITVDTLPIFVVSGPDTLCAGSMATFTVGLTGGSWALTDSLATGATEIAGSYLVTAVNPGIDSVLYVASNICGVREAGVGIFIAPLPFGGIIVGNDSLCSGQPTTYTESEPGGLWSVAGSHVLISSSGIATYLSSGYDTIEYHVTNYCGTADTNLIVYCLSPMTIAPVTGPLTVCMGSIITLSDTSTGGSWENFGGAASLVSMGTAALVNGLSAGEETVYYIISGYCGNDTAAATITVDAAPSPIPIAGPDTLCVGSSITLVDSATGGVWSFSGSGVHLSDSILTGTIAGTDTVRYSYSAVCAPLIVVEKTVNVIAIPYAGAITGATDICQGASRTYADSVVGGVWHILGAGATITTDGVVTGSVSGWDTVFYTTFNYCGSDTALKVVSVDTFVHVSVTGGNIICIGGNDTFYVQPEGGVLMATNANANVDSGYVVTGANAGMDTIVYVYSNVCGADSESIFVKVFSAWGCDSINLVHSVENNIDRQLSIFPNPGTGLFQILLPDKGTDISVSVLDMPGQCVYKANYHNTERYLFYYSNC